MLQKIVARDFELSPEMTLRECFGNVLDKKQLLMQFLLILIIKRL